MSTTDEDLRRIQEIALQHAVDEMDAANGRGLESKDDRGDRGFLTGMASKSLGVAVKIEQFLILRNREGWGTWGADDAAQAEAAKTSMVKSARAEVSEIMKRVAQGSKHRA